MVEMKACVLKEKLASLLDKTNGRKLMGPVRTIEETLGELDICVSALWHDLESTRRENDYLRKLFEDKNK